MRADGDSRPLSDVETATLDFMLSADDPRVEALRDQARHVAVSGQCPCGCATVYLSVDRSLTRPAVGLQGAAINSHSREVSDARRARELIVFVEDGWLSSLEDVYYAGPPPARFPATAEMDPPLVAPP